MENTAGIMEKDAKVTERLMEEALEDATNKYDEYMTVHNRFILSNYEIAGTRLKDISKLNLDTTEKLKSLVKSQQRAITNDEIYSYMF